MANYRELDVLIGQLNGYLLELDNDDNFEEAVRDFMEGIYEIFETPYYLYSVKKYHQDFIAASAAKLEPVVVEVVDSYLERLEDFLRQTWYGDEWLEVVAGRSAVAALLSLYGETNLATHLKEIETEDIDEIIRNKGTTEGYLNPADIPSLIPHEHWWWWWPRSPS